MSYADEVLADSPLLYVRLGLAGLVDQSGNGHDGTAVGGVTVGGAAGAIAGDDDTATNFDGTNDEISFTYKPWASAGLQRTIECWASRDTLTNDGLWGTDADIRTSLLAVSSGGDADGTGRRMRFSNNSGSSVDWPEAFDAPSGELHHVVLTYNDATKIAQLWVDSRDLGAQALSLAQPGSTVNRTFLIGSDITSGAGGNSFDGQIDEVAIYAGELSQRRINAHFLSGLVGLDRLTAARYDQDVASIKRGTTRPLTFKLTRDGLPIDLTGASVEFHARERNGDVIIIGDATLTDEEEGEGVYVWASGETDTVGDYDVEYSILFPDGKEETVPGSGHELLRIVQDLG